MSEKVKKWLTTGKKFIGDFRIFNLYEIERQHPDRDKAGKFVVLDSPRWVNIIPVTKDNKVVFIEQYRHGIDEITLEVPGGLVESTEEPIEAAARECTEETGYIGKGAPVLLGENIPNPAFLNNKCWSYVWHGCEKATVQKLDGHEDIRIVEIPFNEVKEMILNGRIKHSLVLTAFFFYFLKYDTKSV